MLQGSQMRYPIIQSQFKEKGHHLRDTVSVEPHVYVSLGDEDLKKMPIDEEALKTKMELILRRNNISLWEGEGYYSLLNLRIIGLVNTTDHGSAGTADVLTYKYELTLNSPTYTYNNGIARRFYSDLWKTGNLGVAGSGVYEEVLNNNLEEATEEFALDFLKAKSRKPTEEEKIASWRYEQIENPSLTYEQQLDIFYMVHRTPDLYKKEEE